MGLFFKINKNRFLRRNAFTREDLVHDTPDTSSLFLPPDSPAPMSPGKRKFRATVQCITFVNLLDERIEARRKFRAAVRAVILTNSLGERCAARQKFRAAVNVLILSDRLVNRPLDRQFDLEAFQDAVNLVVSINRLERRPETTKSTIEQHKKMARRNGFLKLGRAADKVLDGETPGMGHPAMELHGKLVHRSKDFTTLWEFVEDEKPSPKKE